MSYEGIRFGFPEVSPVNQKCFMAIRGGVMVGVCPTRVYVSDFPGVFPPFPVNQKCFMTNSVFVHIRGSMVWWV